MAYKFTFILEDTDDEQAPKTHLTEITGTYTWSELLPCFCEFLKGCGFVVELDDYGGFYSPLEEIEE